MRLGHRSGFQQHSALCLKGVESLDQWKFWGGNISSEWSGTIENSYCSWKFEKSIGRTTNQQDINCNEYRKAILKVDVSTFITNHIVDMFDSNGTSRSKVKTIDVRGGNNKAQCYLNFLQLTVRANPHNRTPYLPANKSNCAPFITQININSRYTQGTTIQHINKIREDLSRIKSNYNF